MPNQEDVKATHQEASSNEVDNSDRPTLLQRRADALVLMVEHSLNAAGTDVCRADRYQVITHMDTKDLTSDSDSIDAKAQNSQSMPTSLHVETRAHINPPQVMIRVPPASHG